MKIDKYNAEGYYDPTAYEALKRIERPFMPLVYICSPYSGDIEGNTIKAQAHCRFAVDSEYIPIAMHLLLPQFMDDDNPKERDLALFMDLVVMGKCREVWVFGEYISEGMRAEIDLAKDLNIPIRYFDYDMEELK